MPLEHTIVGTHPRDNRVLFIIPWGDQVYVGTTDTDYEGDPREVSADKLQALREHIALERQAVEREDVPGRTELLGDFHVRMAELMGNTVLAQILGELISRCALITLMYQSRRQAQHSSDEHEGLVQAMAAGDTEQAVRLMHEHLDHVEASLTFDRKIPTHDISLALS